MRLVGTYCMYLFIFICLTFDWHCLRKWCGLCLFSSSMLAVEMKPCATLGGENSMADSTVVTEWHLGGVFFWRQAGLSDNFCGHPQWAPADMTESLQMGVLTGGGRGVEFATWKVTKWCLIILWSTVSKFLKWINAFDVLQVCKQYLGENVAAIQNI